MAYEFMYNIAMDLINARLESGEYITPEDTVCAVFTRSGKIYTGISRTENFGGQMVSVHAEIDAIRNMQAYNENAIEAIILALVAARTIILPCNNCISYILSLDSQNSQSWVVVTDRLIRLDEISRFITPQPDMNINVPPPPASHTNIPPVSDPIIGRPSDLRNNRESIPELEENLPYKTERTYITPTEKANGDYLKKRLNNLMSVTEDDEDDLSDETKKGKKLFGGLFGR